MSGDICKIRLISSLFLFKKKKVWQFFFSRFFWPPATIVLRFVKKTHNICVSVQLFFNDKKWDNCIVHLSSSIGIVLGVFCALLRVLKIRSQHVITNLKDDIFCHILLCHALLLLYNSLQFAFCQSQIRQKTLCSRRSSSKFKKNTCANKQTLSNRYLHIYSICLASIKHATNSSFMKSLQ